MSSRNHAALKSYSADKPFVAEPVLLSYQTSDGIPFFIAHDNGTRQMPGNGGLRVKLYSSASDGRQECKRLAQVMTHKHSLYHTGFTGAKLVAVANPQTVNKAQLLQSVAVALNELGGSVYTGCDMNTTEADMEYLRTATPYVLAALESSIDANRATAHGVFGSILSLCDGKLRGRRFFVHGTGGVGANLARLIAEGGGTVLTYDLFPERAALPGCINLSHLADPWVVECDVFAPCSDSNLITESVAARLNCQWIAGSANVPIASQQASQTLAQRSIRFVPEALTSAGAVICDSVEQYNPTAFFNAQPHEIYAFVEDLVRAKTNHLQAVLDEKNCSELDAMTWLYEDLSQLPCGTRFRSVARAAKA
jgi:leucine dehydrogenase